MTMSAGFIGFILFAIAVSWFISYLFILVDRLDDNAREARIAKRRQEWQEQVARRREEDRAWYQS